MARGNCTFKQRDATAAVKAVVAAGCKVTRVEVEKDGKIIVIVGEPEEPARDGRVDQFESTGRNEWDDA
jgi:hypothetical protein